MSELEAAGIDNWPIDFENNLRILERLRAQYHRFRYSTGPFGSLDGRDESDHADLRVSLRALQLYLRDLDSWH
jgi:hypothetical protein